MVIVVGKGAEEGENVNMLLSTFAETSMFPDVLAVLTPVNVAVGFEPPVMLICN